MYGSYDVLGNFQFRKTNPCTTKMFNDISYRVRFTLVLKNFATLSYFYADFQVFLMLNIKTVFRNKFEKFFDNTMENFQNRPIHAYLHISSHKHNASNGIK